MTSPDTLFDLVHSLNKQEKRYFNLYLKRNKEEGYISHLKLFNIYAGLNKFDAAKLKKKIQAAGIVRHIAEIKYKLQQSILKSLNLFHSASSNEIKLRDKINQVEILSSKMLFRQCEKLIEKTKSSAYKIENYPIIMELIRLQRNILFKTSDSRQLNKELNRLFREKNNINQQQIITDKLLEVCDKLYMLHYSKGIIRNKKDIQEARSVLKNATQYKINKIISDRAKYYFHHAHCLYAYMIQDDHMNYLHSQANFKLMENNPAMVEENISRYISILSGLGVASLNLKRYKEYELVVKKLREIPKRFQKVMDTNTQVMLFELVNFQELNYLVSRTEFEKGLTMAQNLEKEMEFYRGKIFKSSENILNYNCSLIYFGTGDYHKCIKSLNKIIHSTAAEAREDVQSIARILLLVCHFQMNNTDILPYIINSTTRYLTSRQNLYNVEKIILNTLKKLNNVVLDRNETVRICKSLKSELTPWMKDPREKVFFLNFDFISWLESIIQRKPFVEILKSKLAE